VGGKCCLGLSANSTPAWISISSRAKPLKNSEFHAMLSDVSGRRPLRGMPRDDLQGRSAVFGRFQFCFSTRHLHKDGIRLRVEDKPAQLLALLLSRAGEVITREEMQNLLWPEGVHVDYDHGLNKSINKLRFVLGDDPAEPRFIETLPRLGYRFIGAVQIVEDGKAVVPAPHLDLRPAVVLASESALSSADSPVSRRERGYKRQLLLATIALGVLAGTFAGLSHQPRIGQSLRQMLALRAKPIGKIEIHALKIEQDGALDPLDGGFRLHRPDENISQHVLYNRETNGWDRWRIITSNQNYYYRPLSNEEKDFALQRDWKLTCVCALEKGAGFSDIDFVAKGPRFDIAFLQEGNKYYVGLTRQISPKFEWMEKIEFAGVADVEHPHTYELRYDHFLRTASLWIDGGMRASGYAGHQQFQEDRGLMFGAAIYGDATRSSFVTRTVRFEAY
jgi:DNA-binding winged helix-turn-helix (wHTH) protein